MKPPIEIATEINEDGTAICHCTSVADIYRTRTFINQLGWEIKRVFYRCRNCCSRLSYDFIPKEHSQQVSLTDILKMDKENFTVYK